MPNRKKMKQCPQCERTYEDETLNFCLEDGTALVPFSEAATRENFPRPTEPETLILPSEQKTEELPAEKATVVKSQIDSQEVQGQPIVRQGVSPVFAYLTVGLLGLLVLIGGVGLFVWVNSSKDGGTEVARETAPPQSPTPASENKTIGETDSKVGKEDSDPESTRTPESKPTPTPAKKESPKETPKPTETPAPTPEKTPEPPTGGKWFVILGSYPQSQSGRARERLQYARSKGFNATIINTNNYPNLRNGLFVVVMGPFSKAGAQSTLSRVKPSISDAYVKSGN
ncbi:MAG: SPOR domain-containing protein [Pyrinomonadaceae bacterium]